MRVAPVVSIVLALAPAFACRSLLGIDEDGPLLPSGDAAGLGDDAAAGAEGGVVLDAALDGAPDAGLTAVDRRFAQWPLPPPSPLLSQYDLTPDTVTDKITGLVWKRNDTTPVSMSYPAAVAYCDGLTLAGQSDWRLATRIELLTILDYGRATGGMLNTTVFPDGTQPAATTVAWTASLSLLRAKLDDHLDVDVYLGTVDYTNIAQTYLLARCVRGGPATTPVDPYVVGGGVARDVRTGLFWQLAPSTAILSLAEAEATCTALAIGGVAGWRLPSVRELASLVDESREQVPMLPPIFSAGPTPTFWSSTARKNPASANYTVNFATANVAPREFATDRYSARCVR